jgi:hypothetical protein
MLLMVPAPAIVAKYLESFTAAATGRPVSRDA